VQYLLVGFALLVFYTLMLSISEHLNFNWAYIISSVATIALIVAYSKAIFKSNKLTLILGAVLVALYLFMFIVLQLQDFALLMGSIGLFAVLAIVMFISRKIDWYNFSVSAQTDQKN
jgi:inner membrane protein